MMTPPTAHESLKLSTYDSHRSIEPKMNPYFSKPSDENYKDMLSKYDQFYKDAEKKFRDFSGWPEGLEMNQRLQKTGWLKKDMSDLKSKPAAVSDFHFPEINSKAEFLGAMYVLEGSTLGGQVLLRRFKDALGISETQGGHFFNGYGSETGLMWCQFLSVLNRELQTTEEIQTAVHSAQRTFRLMEEIFQ